MDQHDRQRLRGTSDRTFSWSIRIRGTSKLLFLPKTRSIQPAMQGPDWAVLRKTMAEVSTLDLWKSLYDTERCRKVIILVAGLLIITFYVVCLLGLGGNHRRRHYAPIADLFSEKCKGPSWFVLISHRIFLSSYASLFLVLLLPKYSVVYHYLSIWFHWAPFIW